MFDFLKDFDKIIVTGPQRSGTTICAKMIALDLGKRYIDEDRLRSENGQFDIEKLHALVNRNDFVVQCPSFCAWVHLYFGQRNDSVIVLMKRAITDIIASQDRIGWTERYEKRELLNYEEKRGPISVVKYRYWYDVQKYLIKNWFEIEYESLSKHPLWIPKKERIYLGPRNVDRRKNSL